MRVSYDCVGYAGSWRGLGAVWAFMFSFSITGGMTDVD